MLFILAHGRGCWQPMQSLQCLQSRPNYKWGQCAVSRPSALRSRARTSARGFCLTFSNPFCNVMRSCAGSVIISLPGVKAQFFHRDNMPHENTATVILAFTDSSLDYKHTLLLASTNSHCLPQRLLSRELTPQPYSSGGGRRLLRTAGHCSDHGHAEGQAAGRRRGGRADPGEVVRRTSLTSTARCKSSEPF